MKKVEIYTDGYCLRNPGPGGWAAILVYGDIKKEISGYSTDTTNNKMEITAVIHALRCLKERCEVTVFSDSQYVCNGINKSWAQYWRSRGWRKADGKKAKNIELWKELLHLCEMHDVKFVWVRGHSGVPLNERCDELALAESMKADNIAITGVIT